MPYYGLYIPTKAVATTGAGVGSTTPTTVNGINAGDVGDQNSTESPYVYREKCEALEVLKLHKDARLREFSNEDDAVKYALTGYEVVQTKYADVKTSTANLEKAAFRLPTKQELIEFRKIIEAGDYERVKSIIWDNPRYLVSSGDTPTTLKEGYRYNAMHVCAISKKPHIAELLLQTVSDPKFVDLLTGKRNDLKMCKELCVNLLDYYLNIPEKGRSETPLHLAAKTGGLEMIEVLTSYPECKMTRNSDGLLARDIICSRFPQAAPELCKKIESLLEERFYVPVLCSMDSAIPPQIGQPFSATNPPQLNSDRLNAEVKIQALAGPMKEEQAKQFRRRWKTPPRLGSNASSPIANNPFISPMKARNGITGSGGSVNTPIKSMHHSNTHCDSPYPIASMQRRTLFSSPYRSSSPCINGSSTFEAADTDNSDSVKEATAKSDEQNGNGQAESSAAIIIETNAETLQIESNNNNDIGQQQQQHVTTQNLVHGKTREISMLKTALCPRTPLLMMKKDIFFTYREQTVTASPMPFADEANLELNSSRDLYDSPGFKERNLKITDTEKGLEVIGRELAKENNIGWREYWDFLNVFIDISSAEGLQKLENHFAHRAKEAEMSKKTAEAMANTAVILDNVCNALEKFNFIKDIGADALTQARNGFAGERFGNTIPTPTAAAAPQATTPYTCVEKSLQVFAKRMTKTIIHNIENVISINDTLLSELKRLKSLICSFKEDVRFHNVNFAKVHSRIGNLISIYLQNSQEVTYDVRAKIQNIMQNLLFTPGERREHIECVCARILFMMARSIEQILPENLKTEAMCSVVWQEEKECDCQWESNLSRKTSRRNRMEARYKIHQAKQQEKSVKKDSDSNETGTLDDWRNPLSSNNDSSDDMEDDVFWSDFGGSDSDEEDEQWQTPPESPSLILMQDAEDDGGYKIYVYGNEPTKRDLDVLNAIFHIDLDKNKYPNIQAWKAALLCYPNEEMDYFPSPAVVKKSHSLNMQNSFKKSFLQTPQLKSTTTISTATPCSPKSQSKKGENKPAPQPQSTAKRLFMSPTADTQNTAVSTLKTNSSTGNITSQSQFITPLNKIRGLFSSYRERHDSSPMSASSASPAAFSSASHNGNEGSNLSLLNVSASE